MRVFIFIGWFIKSVIKFPFNLVRGIFAPSATHGRDPLKIPPPSATHGRDPLKEQKMRSSDQEKNENLDLNIIGRSVFAGEVLIERGDLKFPNIGPRPGTYCISLQKKSGELNVYIGESEQLGRQFQHLRTPGSKQKTNLRLNLLIKEIINTGGKVWIDVITSAFMNGENLDLEDKTVRSVIKHAWIFDVNTRGLRPPNLSEYSITEQKRFKSETSLGHAKKAPKLSGTDSSGTSYKSVPAARKLNRNTHKERSQSRTNKKITKKSMISNTPDRNRGNIPVEKELCMSCGGQITILGKCRCS